MSSQASPVGLLAPRATSAEDRSWRSVVRDGSLVGGGTIATQVLGVATALLLRALLSPAQMGLWQGLKLVLAYAGFVNLGVTKAAAREVTIARGRERAIEAQQSRNLAFSFSIATTLVYALALTVAAAWVWSQGESTTRLLWAIGLVSMAAVCLAQRFLTFHIVMLRAERQFATAARLAILEAVLTLGICGAATWAWGLYGLLGGCLSVSLIGGWVARRMTTNQPGWAWNIRDVMPLIAIGLPIVLTGLVMTLFQSVDKLMVLAYLPDGAYQLGIYSTALLVTTQLSGVANILATTMAPRYGEMYGRWNCERKVAALAAGATELHAALSALAAGVALVAGGPVLAWLLPNYAAGLPALGWLIPGSLALAVSLPATQYLVTIKRQNRGLFSACMALGVAALGNYVALSAGWGLLGVAAATCISQALFAVFVIGGSFWNALRWQRRVRYVAAVLGIVFPTLLVAQLAASSTGDWPQVMLGLLAVFVTWAVSCGMVWHTGHWHELWHD